MLPFPPKQPSAEMNFTRPDFINIFLHFISLMNQLSYMVNTLLSISLIISATNETVLPVACKVHAHIEIV